MRPPRIAYFPDSFLEINGVAHTSRHLVNFAREQERPLLCVHAGRVTRRTKVSAAVSRFELERGRMSFGLEHDLRFDLGLWRHAQAVRAEVQAFGADVIHVTGPNDVGLLGAYLAHAMGLPLVASWHTNLHDFSAWRLEKLLSPVLGHRSARIATSARRQAWKLLMDFYRLAKVQLAPNPELAAEIGHATGLPVRLMARGVDTGVFTPARRQRRDHRFRIGYVGRLAAEKNVRALVALDRELESRNVGAYEFVIVGDGSERAWLDTALPRATLTGTLTGDALANAYANLDLFVFPSQTDTYGNVVQEALSSGVPAIVTTTGGPRFLVREGETGFVCDNPTTWAEIVGRLMQAPEWHDTLRQQARQHALGWSWDSVFESLYDAYDEARTLRHGPRPGAPVRQQELTWVARTVYSVFQRLVPKPAPRPAAPRAIA